MGAESLLILHGIVQWLDGPGRLESHPRLTIEEITRTKRRWFFAVPSLALPNACSGRAPQQETLVVCADGSKFRVTGWISRAGLAVGSSAADVLQRALDPAAQAGGGKVMLGPGIYPFGSPAPNTEEYLAVRFGPEHNQGNAG